MVSHKEISCIDIKEVDLQSHQKNVVKFIEKNPNKKGIIIFHGLGSGKTITSIVILRCLLKNDSTKEAIVLTPTSLIDNYQNELKKFKFEEKEKIRVMSYMKFINEYKSNKVTCNNKIIVIDEAHNFKATSGSMALEMLTCSSNASKVILLTATPIQNNVTDIVNLLAYITPYSRKQIKHIVTNENYTDMKRLLKCNISFYTTPQSGDSNYPEKIEHDIILKMGEEYYKKYYNIQEDLHFNLPEIFKSTKNLTVFFNGIRRAVNVVDKESPKIIWTVNKIIEDNSNNKKVLVYSNWKNTGINVITKLLDEIDIKYSLITGSISKNKRVDELQRYNSGKTKVILITSAGGEGLNLKNTRTVIILEPHWNNEKLNQVKGRAIRYKSHSSLPKNERKVDIYNLILVKPEKLLPKDNLPSADEILRDMAKSKDIIIKEFYNNVKRYSIEDNPDCMKLNIKSKCHIMYVKTGYTGILIKQMDKLNKLLDNKLIGITTKTDYYPYRDIKLPIPPTEDSIITYYTSVPQLLNAIHEMNYVYVIKMKGSIETEDIYNICFVEFDTIKS
jgi:SNF2 family DNA or RNA helicase